MINILKYWKIIICFVVVLVVSYMYLELKNTRHDLADNVSELNDVKQQLTDQKQAIESFKQKLNNNLSIIKTNEEKQTKIELEVKAINANLAKHDLEKIATKKPKLLENVINRSANKTNKELMEVTK